jgi:hypothetical protein
MKYPPRVIAVCIVMMLCAMRGWTQSGCLTHPPDEGSAGVFVITGLIVQMPVGAFVLIRKNGSLAAIRLTSADHTNTEYLGKSTWEAYFQADSSQPLSSSNAVRTTGSLDIKPRVGSFHHSHQPGQDTAHVGPWTVTFPGPNAMFLSDNGFWHGVFDKHIDFAPTSACKLSDIDPHDSRLRWFHNTSQYGHDRLELPLKDLTK